MAFANTWLKTLHCVVFWELFWNCLDVFLAKRFKMFSILGFRKSLFQHVYLLPARDDTIFLTSTVTQANRTQMFGVTRVGSGHFFHGPGSVHHGWEGWEFRLPFTFWVDADIGVGERESYSFSPNWTCFMCHQLISRGAKSALLTKRNRQGKNYFPKA